MKKIFVLFFLVFGFVNLISANLFERKISKVDFYGKDKTVYEFSAPTSIVEIDNEYYILDSGVGVFQFNKERVFKKKIYGIGQGPEEINQRTVFMLAKGKNLFIPDTFNGRILVYNSKSLKKAVIKSPKMSFITNGVVKGEDIYFGGVNSIFKLKSDKSIEKIDLNLGNPNESIIHLLSKKNGKIFTVSMVLHGKKLNKIYTWCQMEGKFAFKEIEIPVIEKLEQWKRKTKFPILITSCFSDSQEVYLTSKIFSEQKGTLLFKINKNEVLEEKYLKSINYAMFTNGFIVDGDNGTIFKY